MLPEQQASIWCHSEYKKLFFKGEPQKFLVGKGANHFPVG